MTAGAGGRGRHPRLSGSRLARLQTHSSTPISGVMAADEHDVRIERRLRLGIRLVFYPLCLGLIALTWSHHRRGSATQALAQPQQRDASWVGATEQGEMVQAGTVDGVFSYFQTRVVTHCLDGTTWTLRLIMSGGEFRRTGGVMAGRQGPSMTISDQAEPVLVTTRVRVGMHHETIGTIASDVTRRPGPGRVLCSSYELTYTLRRATDPLRGDERHQPRLTSLRCSVLSGVRRDDLGCRRLALAG
jgi:hypothetical protein